MKVWHVSRNCEVFAGYDFMRRCHAVGVAWNYKPSLGIELHEGDHIYMDVKAFYFYPDRWRLR